MPRRDEASILKCTIASVGGVSSRWLSVMCPSESHHTCRAHAAGECRLKRRIIIDVCLRWNIVKRGTGVVCSVHQSEQLLLECCERGQIEKLQTKLSDLQFQH